MASLSDVSPAWCSPAAMLLANDRDGSLIIFVTEFVVVVLCLFENALFYHEIDVFLCRTLFAVHLLGYEACQHPESIGIFVLEDHRGRVLQSMLRQPATKRKQSPEMSPPCICTDRSASRGRKRSCRKAWYHDTRDSGSSCEFSH